MLMVQTHLQIARSNDMFSTGCHRVVNIMISTYKYASTITCILHTCVCVSVCVSLCVCVSVCV